MLGMAVLSPGEISRAESLRRSGREGVAICLGVAVMLVVAAAVESYLRQSHLSNAARFIFAGCSALFWAAYFLHGAILERNSRRKEKASTAALY
jgi:uncharacterized membrane protein SpoIIM required for sporulation